MSGEAYEFSPVLMDELDHVEAHLREIERCAKDMDDDGRARDVALLLRVLLAEVRVARKRVEDVGGRLAPVVRAFVWWKSGDSSEDAYDDALDRFRCN